MPAARLPGGQGWGLAFLVLLVFASAPAAAQTVTDPTTVSFTASADHNSVGSTGAPVVLAYELEFFQASASTPLLVLNLGKPSPASDGTIAVDFWSMLGAPPSPGQQLVARVAAVGPTGRGESASSNPFVFTGTTPTPGGPPLPTPSPAPTPSPSPNPSPSPSPSPSPVPSPAPSPSPTTPTADSLIPLVVRITSPGYGSTVRLGDALTIVSIVNHDVSGVDFYANGALIGTAASRPYQVRWVGKKAGHYALTAVTVGPGGTQSVSAPIYVSVTRFAVHPRTPPPAAPIVGKAKEKAGK